jgi:membrane protein involved in colicin uptake
MKTTPGPWFEHLASAMAAALAGAAAWNAARGARASASSAASRAAAREVRDASLEDALSFVHDSGSMPSFGLSGPARPPRASGEGN